MTMHAKPFWTSIWSVWTLGFVLVLGACSQPSESPSASGSGATTDAPAEPAHPQAESVCDDGIDEDGDGATDCKDRDCAPFEVCQIARCQEVCADIMACSDITDACSDRELKGVLQGCQASCSDSKVRGQVVMADGVPCMIIGSVFLGQVQSQNLCLGDEAAGAGNAAGAPEAPSAPQAPEAPQAPQAPSGGN
jgi:hypothetical protein